MPPHPRKRMGEDCIGPILVTGFGPFHNHAVNASWAAVQELEKIEILNSDSQIIPLVTKEVPVVYDVVTETIPKLLKELTPRLCIHVGVSPYKTVVMEKFGRNSQYIMEDIHGKTPEQYHCVASGPDCLETKFDLTTVLEKVAKRQTDVQFAISSDAGRYLCDYIYYTSLHANCAPVVFVHVPELGAPYTVHQLATALKNIIEVLLNEL